MIKEFKTVGIAPTLVSFAGEKIKIDKVLNIDIIVLDYKIEPSKFSAQGDGNRLVLSITKGEEQRIIFSSSLYLRNQILKVAKEDFPFKTKIQKINDHYEFT